jgi:outer membrane protein assembly factor BamB
VAFDLQTGEQKWKIGDDLASYSSPRTMQIGGSNAVIVLARNGLIAVDAKTGRKLWRFDHRASILESVNAMMPVVKGNQVFISECYQIGSALLEVDQESAKVLWSDDRRSREKSMRSHWSTPVLIGDYLYGCSGRNAPDSDFRCIRFSTGEPQWVDPRRTRTSVTRWGDHLLVMEERGRFEVMKVNPKEMEVVARYDLSVPDGERPALKFPCWSAPIVVGDRMLLRGDQKMICLRWKSGY